MPGAPNVPLDRAAQALELVELGYSQRIAGEITGIPQQTVSQILNRHGKWGEVAEEPVWRELRSIQKRHFQAATLQVCKKALEQVDLTIGKASAYQAAGIYGLLRDHERKDAGESTENVSIRVEAAVTIDDLSARLSQRLIDPNSK